jgi:hypothetical protein
MDSLAFTAGIKYWNSSVLFNCIDRNFRPSDRSRIRGGYTWLRWRDGQVVSQKDCHVVDDVPERERVRG